MLELYLIWTLVIKPYFVREQAPKLPSPNNARRAPFDEVLMTRDPKRPAPASTNEPALL